VKAIIEYPAHIHSHGINPLENFYFSASTNGVEEYRKKWGKSYSEHNVAAHLLAFINHHLTALGEHVGKKGKPLTSNPVYEKNSRKFEELLVENGFNPKAGPGTFRLYPSGRGAAKEVYASFISALADYLDTSFLSVFLQFLEYCHSTNLCMYGIFEEKHELIQETIDELRIYVSKMKVGDEISFSTNNIEKMALGYVAGHEDIVEGPHGEHSQKIPSGVFQRLCGEAKVIDSGYLASTLAAAMDEELLRHFRKMTTGSHPLADKNSQEKSNVVAWETLGKAERFKTKNIVGGHNNLSGMTGKLKSDLVAGYKRVADTPIRLSIHAMQISSVAALVEMQKMLYGEMEIDVFCSSSSSPSHIGSISGKESPHFVVTADAGVYFSDEKSVSGYKRSLTVWVEDHCVIRNHEGERGSILVYMPETTQELHKRAIQSQFDHDLGRLVETPVPEQYRQAKELIDENVTLCMTVPKALPLVRDLGFYEIPRLRQQVSFGLYTRSEALDPGFAKDFLTMFAIAYRDCARKYLNENGELPLHNNYRQEILNALLAIKGLEKHFSYGIFNQARKKPS